MSCVYLLSDYDSSLIISALKSSLGRSFPNKTFLFKSNDFHKFNYEYEVGFQCINGNDFVLIDISLDYIVRDYIYIFNEPRTLKARLDEGLIVFTSLCRRLASSNKELIILQPILGLGQSDQPMTRPRTLYSQHFCISYFFMGIEGILTELSNVSLIHRDFELRSLRSGLVTGIPYDHSQIKSQTKVLSNTIYSLSRPCVKVICVDFDNTLWGER